MSVTSTGSGRSHSSTTGPLHAGTSTWNCAHVRLAVPVLLGRERVVVAEAGFGVLRLLGRERVDVLRQNLVLEVAVVEMDEVALAGAQRHDRARVPREVARLGGQPPALD